MSVRGVGWKALLASGLLIAITLGASFWMVTVDQQMRYNADLGNRLSTAARTLRDTLRDGWVESDISDATGLVQSLQSEGISIIVASTDGDVLIDTTGTTESVDVLLDQPEVRHALLTGRCEADRPLRDSGRLNKIVAVRIGDDSSTLGIVWVAKPSWTFGTGWHSLGRLAAAVGGIALISTLALAITVTQLRTRLLRKLTETARSLSAGDLSAKANIVGSDEYAALSSALNQTRKRLAQQVETIDRQRLTLAAMMEQLHEGVVVVGPDGHVALINPEAIRLLGIDTGRPGGHKPMIGLPLERCIPQHDLQRLIRGEMVADSENALDSGSSDVGRGDRRAEEEIRIQVDTATREVHLLARASDIDLPGDAQSSDEPSTGRVLVLTDITDLTRIIRVKTDFVANASHELRTPLSAIRAAVETLLQLDPASDAPAARRFLDTVDRHSRRLEALVSDLLDLSRLESPTRSFEPQWLNVQRELADLHARFANRLESKRIAWEASRLDGSAPRVAAPPHLLRLVLDNLVDNAIKFTASGGKVSVVFSSGPGWAAFEVTDNGCGIPEAELGRVFERFYQVERARSGEERGTGLGLSIVRHAVAAMHGSVRLRSKPGEGTRVTARIPDPPVEGDKPAPDLVDARVR